MVIEQGDKLVQSIRFWEVAAGKWYKSNGTWNQQKNQHSTWEPYSKNSDGEVLLGKCVDGNYESILRKDYRVCFGCPHSGTILSPHKRTKDNGVLQQKVNSKVSLRE